MAARALTGALTGLLCLACSASAAMRSTHPGPVLYGATIDRTTHLGEMLSALATLPERPTVRIVYDRSEPASYYATATRRLAGSAWVMGELLDSSAERSITAAQLRARTHAYLRALGSYVTIWEVGNELNGDWTGPYPQVAAKARAAFAVVHGAGARTAITLYANDFGPNHCGDGAHELTPLQFARRYLPMSLRDELDYLLLSYYPTECGGRRPASGVVAAHLKALHRLFPHARLGFGEVGLPHPVTPATLHRARQIMRWAYGLDPHLSYYAGGYFWWYAAEDALRPGAPLRHDLADAFTAENAALARPDGEFAGLYVRVPAP